VCAVLSSVCATTVDNSGVHVYYLKGIVSVCLDARLRLWVSLEHACTCAPTTNQAEQHSSTTYPLAG